VRRTWWRGKKYDGKLVTQKFSAQEGNGNNGGKNVGGERLSLFLGENGQWPCYKIARCNRRHEKHFVEKQHGRVNEWLGVQQHLPRVLQRAAHRGTCRRASGRVSDWEKGAVPRQVLDFVKHGRQSSRGGAIGTFTQTPLQLGGYGAASTSTVKKQQARPLIHRGFTLEGQGGGIV